MPCSNRWLVLVAVVALILGACGGSDSAEEAVPTPATETSAGAAFEDLDDLAPVAVGFRVEIENVSGPEEPRTLGPGFWIRHRGPDALFTEGRPDRGEGLESLVETGDATLIAESNERLIRLGNAGLLGPDGAEPGVIGPGERMVFDLEALPGESVTFVLGGGAGQDQFLGPGGIGLALFDATRTPIAGDVTAVARWWDLGTASESADGGRGVVTADPTVDVAALVRITVEPS